MKYNFVLLIAGLVLLSACAIFNTQPFVFDEPLFPPNIELMEKYGFGKQFLLEMKDQAPGPLYEFVHLPLKSLTHLEPQGLRSVNLFFFYITILILTLTVHQSRNFSWGESAYFALHIMAIITLWQVAGLALTEVPAMCMVMVSFYFGAYLINNRQTLSRTHLVVVSALMGISGGLAVLGRTPYLLILPSFAVVVLFMHYKEKRIQQSIWMLTPYFLVAFAMVLPVFIIWKGLVPPLQPRVDGALQPWHGMLAMAYTAIIGLIIRPRWFNYSRLTILLVASVFVIFLILNMLGYGFIYAPMSQTVVKIIGLQFIDVYVLSVSPLLAAIGCWFMLSCFYKAKEHITDYVYLFALIFALAILASSMKISHQFSSRYVAQAAPFLVYIFVDIHEKDSWKWIRIIIGMTLGFLSFNTYAKIF
ncbi:MAG: hypothetical protein JNM57_01130 [Cyclobacteriaceae bacterium]|nr:hypothetical protein [Cyclobacteriaceae bacterium]